MSDKDIKLMAHLMRRAAFGANRDELDACVATGYEATVEDLLNPGDPCVIPDDVIRRLHVDMAELRQLEAAGGYWLYRMITTNNPLEEKIVLFWHGLFATGYSKLNQAKSLLNQLDMFRRFGLGSFRQILVELSKDPTMLIWLDNQDNHKDAINENYGRELLELFSMGIGNYSEQDIKECARAFTGWTLGNVEYMAMRASKDSIWPYGRIAWHFGYRSEDHDDGEKTFLGETGNFNGEEIIDIICKNPAAARFICTRLFQFFSADEINDSGEKVIEAMMDSYFDSEYEIRAVLRTMFNSEYFKSEDARYSRVKCPVEQVVGAIKTAGTYRVPTPGIQDVASKALYMGQGLLQPPSVEGWHEGAEWIDSGALVERVNFVAEQLGDVSNPGVRAIIERIAGDNGHSVSPDDLVDMCLDLMGSMTVSDETREVLTEHVSRRGNLNLADRRAGDGSEERVGEVLSLIAATGEYQLA